MPSLLWIVACVDEPTPEVLLRELAEAHTDPLFAGVQSGVEAQVGSLWDLDDESSESGTLRLPEEAGAVWDAEASLSVDWDLSFDLDEDEGLRTWVWAMALSIDRLALDDAEVAGTGTWAVEDVVWDLHYANHEWDGAISIDDAPSIPVTWTAYYSGNLHRVDGTLDGTAVTWTNDDPDLP